jgi:hypothetical protein
LQECHLKVYKSSLNSYSKRVTYKELFGRWWINLCSVWWFVFFEFLIPFILGGHNFLISNPFSTIVSVSDVSRWGVQVLFGHQKQGSPPLGSCALSASVFAHQPVYPRWDCWIHTLENSSVRAGIWFC